MEGSHHPGFAHRYKTVQRAHAVSKRHNPESPDQPSQSHGAGRPDYPQNISPGSPEGGIYPDRNRIQPETHTGLHGSLGNRLQKEHRTNVNAQRAVSPVSLKSGEHGSYVILI